MASAGLAGMVALAAAVVCVSTGCSTLGYYAHSVGGHLDLLRSARPVRQWMADEAAPASLKERLALTQRIRDYAVSELKEPDNASYRRYAELHRNAAVWNVVAARELSLKLKTWCFPIVGCVGYRGYFDRARADAFA
jgi:predicted aminopeptidase